LRESIKGSKAASGAPAAWQQKASRIAYVFPLHKKSAMLTPTFRVKDSAEFNELMDKVADNIVHAHMHYQLYRDVHQALCDHPRVAPQSNTFWQLTLNAHLNTCWQSLCRVYDYHPQAIHLQSLLITIKRNSDLFAQEAFRQRLKNNPFADSLVQTPRTPDPTTLEEDISRCSPGDPLVKNLIRHRNSHVAHTDAKDVIARRNPHDRYPLMFGDLEALLTRAITILNRYSRLFKVETYGVQPIGHDDYQFIFTSVAEKIRRDDEAIEQLLGPPDAG
jgi:AbiU2